MLDISEDQGVSLLEISEGALAILNAGFGCHMRFAASTITTNFAGLILMDGTLKQFICLLDIAYELDASLTRSTIITIIPGIICVGGVWFFHFGIVSSVILFNLGLVASLVNGLLPLIRQPVFH